MFGFLFRRRSLDRGKDAIGDKEIFPYSDGTRQLRVDPIVILDAMEAACPEYGVLLDNLAFDSQQIPAGSVRDDMYARQTAARKKLVAAVRSAFGVTEYDGRAEVPTGLTERKTVNLLVTFINFMEDLSRAARPTPGSRGTEPDSLRASTTAPSAASTTTAT